jgi:DNA invertase Pin-like site-specific DNA recombinase
MEAPSSEGAFVVRSRPYEDARATSGVVFTVLAAMSGMEREYIRDRTLEGHESARKRGKTIGGAGGG